MFDFFAYDSTSCNRLGALKPSRVSCSLCCTSYFMVHCICAYYSSDVSLLIYRSFCVLYLCCLCWYSNKLDLILLDLIWQKFIVCSKFHIFITPGEECICVYFFVLARTISIILQIIAMTSHERYVASNHLPFGYLFKILSGPTSKEHRRPHHWPFVRGIHRWPVNSPHKGPVKREKSSIWWRHHILMLWCNMAQFMQGSLWVWAQPMGDDVTIWIYWYLWE